MNVIYSIVGHNFMAYGTLITSFLSVSVSEYEINICPLFITASTIRIKTISGFRLCSLARGLCPEIESGRGKERNWPDVT